MKERTKARKQEITIETQDPQESLEKILSVEIEIATRISDAREKSDKEVLEAQNNLNDLKTRIIEKAREERDRMIEQGIADARKDAEKKIEIAGEEARSFSADGKKFLNEAEEMIMTLLLGSVKDSK